ncbi:hypothetical protein Nepgr_015108 [Nepenthes gracilis]|uniref:AP2/ERF domain-containing protein n=1 Tax=Nepenthes gracilis TaxID=150966 RepID=A0AAD3SLK5_NEPGR|nr:hypothetical protein Nepgr_015108 [Nepenthes gracilis]
MFLKNTQMKRSPSSHSFSSSSSSSSSSCVVDHPNNDHQPSKPKRGKKREAPNKRKDNSDINSNKRSSIYRGVTRHRWTGRFEAHLWDKSSWNSNQNKKGRQVYLGAYDSEDDAARTYDLAALKYWGPDTTLNFPIENYTKEMEEMQSTSKAEYLASLRRRSSGFSRGVSKYRGVARHHHNGRWEARIGRVFGNKYLYLGTFGSQEEAAIAYDLAAIEYRGVNAVTNFDIGNYIGRVKNLVPDDRPQPPNHKCLIGSKAMEQQDEQHQQEELVSLSTLSQESSKLFKSIDSSPLMLETNPDHRHEDPWNFCLDTGYDPLLFTDIPLKEDCDLLDLFHETSFEDNIMDLIFEGEADLPKENEAIYSRGTESVCPDFGNGI